MHELIYRDVGNQFIPFCSGNGPSSPHLFASSPASSPPSSLLPPQAVDDVNKASEADAPPASFGFWTGGNKVRKRVKKEEGERSGRKDVERCDFSLCGSEIEEGGSKRTST